MKQFRSIVFLLLLVVISTPSVYAQMGQRKSSISSDAMLEHTLTDLKNQLQEVVADNSKLSARNNALRKRMLSLRQDMRELENHKLGLLERNNDLKDFIKLDAQEHSLAKRKAKEFEEQNSFSGEVTETLEKTIQRNEERSRKLQDVLARTKADLDDIRRSSSSKKVSRDDSFTENKNHVLSQIQQAAAANRILEKKNLELKRKVADLDQKKQDLLTRHTELKSETKTTLAGLKDAIAEEKIISKKTNAKAEDEDKLTGELKAQIAQLTSTYDELRTALDGSMAAKKKVDEEAATQKQAVKSDLDFLTQEKQLLEKKKNLLLTRLNWEGVNSNQGRREIEEKLDALTKELEPLKTENTELKNKIAEQTRQQQNSKIQETALKQEMAQFGQDIKRIKNKSQQSIDEALKDQKTHLTKLLNSYHMKNQAIQKQIAVNQDKSKQSKDRVTSWPDRQKENEAALKEAADELQKAKDAEGAIHDEAKSLEGHQDERAAKLKDEIGTLELRKSIVMSSYEAIKNKYSQDKDTIKDFVRGDQKQLEEYLNVLKTENLSLKSRLASLTQTVQDLEKQ